MSRPSAIITVTDLIRRYEDGTEALRGVRLEVASGECLILSGVSGSGKSTLLGILAGLERPTSGQVVVDGQPIARLPEGHLNRHRRERVGIIFQDFGLIGHLSVRENVAAALVSFRLSHDAAAARVAAAMEQAQIFHKADALTHRLSGGEKQRCAIARALVNDPPILLCDEPTANLDRENSLRFVETLEMLHRQGRTLVVATHDPLFDVLDFSARHLVIDGGRIVSASPHTVSGGDHG